MNKIQLVSVIIALVFTTIIALMLLGILPGIFKESLPTITLQMWGFDDKKIVDKFLREYTKNIDSKTSIMYTKKEFETFGDEFINALASGIGPDVIVFPSDYLIKHRDKLSVAPPIFITEREIAQDFISSTSFFINESGEILGIPLAGDALVLYWNKDIFTKHFLTLPPKTWDEFSEFARTITEKDSEGNLIISGAAMGRAINNKQAHLILTTLLLQSGDKIIDENGKIVLGNPIKVGNTSTRPSESAIRFMTDFANPQKIVHSWSAALPEAKDFFLAGKVGMYLGLMSEYLEIKEKNPNLDFSIALIPQLGNNVTPVTTGTLYALTVPKQSRYINRAWSFVSTFANRELATKYADAAKTVSTHRATLPLYKDENIRSVFAQSVLALELWGNPNPISIRDILSTAIEEVAIKQKGTQEALIDARSKIREVMDL
jgi:ABC-type glycerol-3-phosphate transport system substrate-binding protein